jgi:hypothetical protein
MMTLSGFWVSCGGWSRATKPSQVSVRTHKRGATPRLSSLSHSCRAMGRRISRSGQSAAASASSSTGRPERWNLGSAARAGRSAGGQESQKMDRTREGLLRQQLTIFREWVVVNTLILSVGAFRALVKCARAKNRPQGRLVLLAGGPVRRYGQGTTGAGLSLTRPNTGPPSWPAGLLLGPAGPTPGQHGQAQPGHERRSHLSPRPRRTLHQDGREDRGTDEHRSARIRTQPCFFLADPW